MTSSTQDTRQATLALRLLTGGTRPADDQAPCPVNPAHTITVGLDDCGHVALVCDGPCTERLVLDAACRASVPLWRSVVQTVHPDLDDPNVWEHGTGRVVYRAEAADARRERLDALRASLNAASTDEERAAAIVAALCLGVLDEDLDGVLDEVH